jgi:D,D-heptose 1,7-bisphosphate phosphatase
MAYKAIFLDRDNTLIEDPGYINNPDQVKLLPGAAAALVQLRQMGYKLIVVTNQSAIARGIVTVKVLGQIHDRFNELLGREGAGVDKIYFCPYHPNGVIAKYRKVSELRKPKPGMLLKAAEEMNIDLGRSWMVGNAYHDIKAGMLAGCRTILVESSVNPALKRPIDPVPDKKAVNIKEAVNIIKMFEQAEDAGAAAGRTIAEVAEPEIETKYTDAETAASQAVVQESAPDVSEQQETAADAVEAAPVVEAAPAVKAAQPPASQARPGGDLRHSMHSEKTHSLLEEMVRHLKNMQRSEMFEDFRTTKMLAGIVQGLVVVCLLMSFWFLMDDTRPADSVHTMIGYAIVLQLMVFAFYVMRD